VKKIFYEKVGRRYIPVSEYDSALLDSFTKGNHLVMSYPGGKSTRYNVDPNYAAMIAAGRVAEDKISDAIRKASDLRTRSKPITPGQRKAWDNLVEEFGEEARQLEWPSAREVAEAGVKAMQEEADKLMQNPSVRDAYEAFLVTCALTRDPANAK
jgi:hypothetical protein